MGQEESWMEMFKKFGTGQARVLVILPWPCTSPGLVVFLSLSSLLSCCSSVPGPPTRTRCLLLYWFHLFSLHRAQRQSSPRASQDQALPASLQLHHHFTWGFASFSEHVPFESALGCGLTGFQFRWSLLQLFPFTSWFNNLGLLFLLTDLAKNFQS